MAGMTAMPDQWKAACRKLFVQAGVPEDEADIVAEVLVTTESWGVRSHGLMRVEHYIRCLLSGGIAPSAKLEVEDEGSSWMTINGHGGLGIVISCKATRMAIDKARKNGICIVNVHTSNHFGAAGYYSMMCAKAGMFGLALSNVGRIMAATGSSTKSIGNNPFAYAAPAGKYGAVMLDICMSQVADGKVQIARDLGIPLPDGCILDKEGRPSNDPHDYFQGGTLLPFGGHKGYGLAVMVEILAGVLSGAAIMNPRAWNKDPNKTGTTGHTFLAVDVGKMMPSGRFEARMEELVRQLHASPAAEHAGRVLYPGQLELENEANAREIGIELLDSCVDSLHRAAELVNVELNLTN